MAAAVTKTVLAPINILELFGAINPPLAKPAQPEPPKLLSINQLTQELFVRAKLQIQQMIAKEAQQKQVMDEASSSELDEFFKDDKLTSYSHLQYKESSAKIFGFIIARESQKNIANKAALKVVTIEKIAVDSTMKRNGLGKSLLNAVAKVASKRLQDEIRVLVYKENKAAMEFYFKYGFNYVDKAKDEPWDSYLLSVKPAFLVQKTEPV